MVVVHDWKGEVQLQRDMDKQCSHIRLCRHSLSIWCSTLVQADLSLATSPLMLSTFFVIMSLYLTSFFISIIFLITCSKPRTGEPIFPHGTCMINVWTCNLYEELALRGVTYGRNSCMMKQESHSCPNSTMKIFWVTAIGSPTSPEFKMLQEGLAQMQNNYLRSIHPNGRF